jgi:thioredoxin-related protein
MAGIFRILGNSQSGWLLLLWLACLALPAAHGNELPAVLDLRSEAEQARRLGGPLIILFSRPDCKYCATVRRDYLLPLSTNSGYGKRLLVHQIDQDSSAPLIDFQGVKTSHAAFAAGEKIKLVPVVAFYGPDGRQLAPAIVGLRLPDFYQAYLDEALALAFHKLQQP